MSRPLNTRPLRGRPLVTLLGVLLFYLAGCEDSATAPRSAPPDGPPDSADAPTGHVAPALDARGVYVRASLDLRGTRPTLEELDRLDADPTVLAAMLDALLAEPAFPTRVKAFFAPAFRTRIDAYPFVDEGSYDDPAALNAAIGEEPLDLVAWIAAHDRPYTDIVLATHSVVRPPLLDVWPLEVIDGEHAAPEGTVLARYSDGRPLAGVLTMNSMWWRHTSTEENANRGRANALSDALLCESYLDRPIAFPRDIDLSDSESIHRAIRQNPACAACHSTLDPLASHLWGFMYTAESIAGRARYALGRERDWLQTTERAPGFFGTPTDNLEALAREIASDERFVMCAVRRVYAGLIGRPLEIADDGALATHREAFLAGELRLRPLVRSILDDPAYRGRTARTDFGGEPAASTWSLLTPEMLASDLESLTGYRMRQGERDLLALDSGLRTVAGGSDRGAATTPSTGLVLVHRRLSEAAAAALVDGMTRGRLSAYLGEDAFEAPPEPETIRDVLRAATARSVIADGPEVSALLGLWEEASALGGDRDAWIALLTAILSDPERLVR